jgi:hypothetical protein
MTLRAFREIVECYGFRVMGNLVALSRGNETNATPRRLFGAGDADVFGMRQSFACRKRSALATTLTEESDMAAAAMIGESRMPNAG